MRLASGVPGKATVPQSANAQSPLPMFVTPVRAPALVSRAMEISVALVVSRLAGVRPRPGSDCVLPDIVTKRAKVGEVTDEPSGFLATGTLIRFGSDIRIRIEHQIALPAARDVDVSRVVGESVAGRLAGHRDHAGAQRATSAVADAVDQDAAGFAHVDRLEQRERCRVRHVSADVARRGQSNVGDDGVAAVVGIDLAGEGASDLFVGAHVTERLAVECRRRLADRDPGDLAPRTPCRRRATLPPLQRRQLRIPSCQLPP